MNEHSLRVPLLSESDMHTYEQILFQTLHASGVAGQSDERRGLIVLEIPDPLDVVLTACEVLLKLPKAQCEALVASVPETNMSSVEYTALVKRIYASNSGFSDITSRAIASQIAVINAVITAYNAGVV